MALKIKNSEVEQLASEVARLASESKTEAIRRALYDRKQRLLIRRSRGGRQDRLNDLLREKIWPNIPSPLRQHGISKAEREHLLGYGSKGI